MTGNSNDHSIGLHDDADPADNRDASSAKLLWFWNG